jgi:hypothetical protein
MNEMQRTNSAQTAHNAAPGDALTVDYFKELKSKEKK